MPSVGVSVDPPLLADLLRILLWAPDRTVHLHGATPSLRGHVCDLAVTSYRRIDTVSAPIRIGLPDDEGNAGWGTMIVSDTPSFVSIRSVEDLLILVARGLSS